MTFETIYNEHYNKVYNWINFKIKNSDAAEELAADVFMKVHSHLNEYDEKKSQVGTWIMFITKNTIIDFFRTNRNEDLLLSELTDEEGHETFVYTSGVTPQTEMQNKELGETIHSAINALPENYSRIANMFLLQELSHEEISNKLNIPIGSVKGSIHRAKELLKTMLRNKLTNL